jgi:hypothetical protein
LESHTLSVLTAFDVTNNRKITPLFSHHPQMPLRCFYHCNWSVSTPLPIVRMRHLSYHCPTCGKMGCMYHHNFCEIPLIIYSFNLFLLLTWANYKQMNCSLGWKNGRTNWGDESEGQTVGQTTFTYYSRTNVVVGQMSVAQRLGAMLFHFRMNLRW